MNDGETDIVDMLTGYIDATNSSINRYRHILGVSRYVPKDMIVELVSGKINGNQFIEYCRKTKPTQSTRSFDEIYSEIKDTDYSYQTHINNTADLFNKGVDYLEEIVGRLLSDEYINTFEESDVDARQTIFDCLERINQVHTVISSLI